MKKFFTLILLGLFFMTSEMQGQNINNSRCSALLGKRLLEWNKNKLTSTSTLLLEDIQELFAPEFIVIANGRKYDANYQNYLEFLNTFRSTIETIEYEVQEYLPMEGMIVMPLKATVKRIQGKEDVFDAIMLLKFNDSGKIIHWQEVYSIR